MACEIATERALTESFSNKEILYLEDAVTSLLNGYNITSRNGRILKLYTALTGDDEIRKQPFWQKLVESTELRNGIIHSGRTVDKMEAKSSHHAASALVVYLNK